MYTNRYAVGTENWQFLFGNETEIDQVTSDWDFYFEISANMPNPLHLNHDFKGNSDSCAHSFIVYIIAKNNEIREFLLGNS